MNLESTINRVRSEFLEMPGLRLSVPQAMRLWGLTREECDVVIDELMKKAFLSTTASGHVIRGA